MRKRVFRIRTTVDHEPKPLVVLTYNLQDIQPWKQATACYQTAIYEADTAGLATTTLVAGPFAYPSEEMARQGHANRVAALRTADQRAAATTLPAAI
ncbi:MAG TPA: hypothetical protein VGP33_02390 [Chloroflexota bacterium]|nr:hypothetical protein [Chloroflexota bacterium]